MDETKSAQRIAELEKENTLLKQQINFNQEEVKAAQEFLNYIMTEFQRHVPDVFQMNFERNWAELGLARHIYKPEPNPSTAVTEQIKNGGLE